MTSSQKFAGYCIVPWANSSEWQQVYINIYGTNSTTETKIEAQNRILMWQQRIPLLPSGIEGTLCIIEAMLADPKIISERQYSSLCATNIMRFLNICVASRSQVNNFTKTVKSNSIPDWIINIRHDLAHSQKLPSPAILKLALQECFKWLKENYWDPEYPLIKDNIIGSPSESACDNNDLPLLPPGCNDRSFLLRMYANMIMYCMSDLEMDDILLSELTKAGFDTSQSKAHLMKLIMSHLQRNKNEAIGLQEEVVIELIASNFLFISPSDLLRDGNKTIYQYIESLLVFLYDTDELIYLLKEMSCILHDKVEPDCNKLSISLWLDAIFRGLAVPKQHNSAPTIKFGATKPKLIIEVLKLQMVLFQNLNQITKHCFKSFMSLSKVPNSKDVDNYVKSNEHLFMSQFKYKIYDNIDDDQDLCNQIKTVDADQLNSSLSCHDYVDTSINMTNEDCELECPEDISENKWVILEDNVEYETCAIGVLPS